MSPSEAPRPRTALIEHDTKETIVQVALSLDGGHLDPLPHDAKFVGVSPTIPAQHAEHHASQTTPSQTIWVWTGIGFLDHMLHTLAKHGGWSLRVRCKGDLYSAWPSRARCCPL